MARRPLELSVVDERKQNDQEPRIGDYERLLGDAMAGDATLFARQDVVEAASAIVDPIIDATPMYEYEPGMWGPPQADRLVAGRFGDGHHAVTGGTGVGIRGQGSVVRGPGIRKNRAG